jgi:uncharacterized protein YbbC (DUF1343 family)/CubicO group peptidase (beta-lactamase class C family)
VKYKFLVALFVFLASGGAFAQELWPELDREIEAAITDGEMPGAVLLVGRGDDVLYHRAYGLKTEGMEMSRDDLFDAASLTKPLVTALAVLLLAEENKIDLDAPLTEYFPVSWESVPTVRQLLTHHSGLPPGLPTEDFPEKLLKVEPQLPPGSKFVYSDVGYLLLGKLVEKQSGLALDEFFDQNIAKPLGLADSTFQSDPTRSVPTYDVEPGTVHDPRSRKVDGIAGHAGLFVTAKDVHRQLAKLSEILSPESLELYWEQQEGGRTLGLDSETRYSAPRGARFSPRTSAGHTGFTGTSFWWDRPSGLHIILLTSRLHPDNKGNVIPLRRALSSKVADHFLGVQVKTGLDQLVASDFEALKGKRVGWILNHTSRDRSGRHLLELLPETPEFELQALLTPEHGLEGVRDEKIEHGFHSELGVPIFSLYGETRRPKKEWFENLDVLVFDLQDVGVRYYTYITTLKYCMEMAKKTGTTVLVLDRPNPLGGELVDGHRASVFHFICCDSLPLIHGMTVGEVAGFLNREIGADLVVQTMDGWRRDMTWEDTGLPFLSPSPNLAELESVDLYPVLGQLEWGDLSVGRGTKSPFRVIGAPYIKDPLGLAEEFQRALKEHPLTFRPRLFIPQSSKFDGQVCGGVEVEATGALERPAEAGLVMARVLARRYPQHFRPEDMARHLGTDDVHALMKRKPDLAEWRNIRQPYLLYP